jgi:hypothetical protein
MYVASHGGKNWAPVSEPEMVPSEAAGTQRVSALGG